MCGRFTLAKPPDALTRHFALPRHAAAAAPRYKIAPSQAVSAVRTIPDGSDREMVDLSWGLLPFWSRDPKGMRTINARAETIAAKPAFREPFRKRRCLIPADGFYEWQWLGKRKQPWYIHRADGELFAFGGLWDRWRDPATGDCIESCAIVTTAPNPLIAPVHDRMPLILAPADYEAWLSPLASDPSPLLKPFPADLLRMHRVGTGVGSPANNTPECTAPLPADSPPAG